MVVCSGFAAGFSKSFYFGVIFPKALDIFVLYPIAIAFVIFLAYLVWMLVIRPSSSESGVIYLVHFLC